LLEGNFGEFGHGAHAQPRHDAGTMEFNGLTETRRTSAISLLPRPSTISCRISRWRSVNSSDSLLSQTLAYIAIDVGKLVAKTESPETIAYFRSLQRRAADAAEGVRRISHELHPSILDDIGLTAALEQYCAEFQERSGIVTHFSSNNVPDAITPNVASSIYHIAQESLRNVSKHSQTQEVFVEIETIDNVLRLSVKDRGIGLGLARPETATGIGIIGM
jgi:signal transduction histidine kinase